MSSLDQIAYGHRARLRVAFANQAAGIADSARGLVATYADGYAQGGEFVEAARSIVAGAAELLTLAVAYERCRGTSWAVIGEGLGISGQVAHERYAEAEKRLADLITEAWLLGDDPRMSGLPSGAAAPAELTGLLDRWVTRHLQPTDPLAHQPDDHPERTHPVSHNLRPMDTLEHSTFVLAGASLIMDLRRAAQPDDERIRHLELGLARRKVELYERMAADEAAAADPTSDYGTVRDLLTGARARLAELEAATASGTEPGATGPGGAVGTVHLLATSGYLPSRTPAQDHCDVPLCPSCGARSPSVSWLGVDGPGAPDRWGCAACSRNWETPDPLAEQR